MHPWFAELISPEPEEDVRRRAGRRRKATRINTIRRKPAQAS